MRWDCFFVGWCVSRNVFCDFTGISISHPSKTLVRLFPGVEEHYLPYKGLSFIHWHPYEKCKVHSLIGSPRISMALSRVVVERCLEKHGIENAALEVVGHHYAHAAKAAFSI